MRTLLFFILAFFAAGCSVPTLTELKDNTIKIRTQIIYQEVDNGVVCDSYDKDAIACELIWTEEAAAEAGLNIKFVVVNELTTNETAFLDTNYCWNYAAQFPDMMTIMVMPYQGMIAGITRFPDDEPSHGICLYGRNHHKYLLAHEIGHVFFLQHTFNDFPENTPGDFILYTDRNILGYGFNRDHYTQEQMHIVREMLQHPNRKPYIMK